jgi:hypothetical protein
MKGMTFTRAARERTAFGARKVGGANRESTFSSRSATREETIQFWLHRLGPLLAVLCCFGLAASFTSTVYLRLAKDLPPYNEFLKHWPHRH